jgi:hypothetical protein
MSGLLPRLERLWENACAHVRPQSPLLGERKQVAVLNSSDRSRPPPGARRHWSVRPLAAVAYMIIASGFYSLRHDLLSRVLSIALFAFGGLSLAYAAWYRWADRPRR